MVRQTPLATGPAPALIALLTIAIAVSGCLSDDPEPSAAPPPDQPTDDGDGAGAIPLPDGTDVPDLPEVPEAPGIPPPPVPGPNSGSHDLGAPQGPPDEAGPGSDSDNADTNAAAVGQGDNQHDHAGCLLGLLHARILIGQTQIDACI